MLTNRWIPHTIPNLPHEVVSPITPRRLLLSPIYTPTKKKGKLIGGKSNNPHARIVHCTSSTAEQRRIKSCHPKFSVTIPPSIP